MKSFGAEKLLGMESFETEKLLVDGIIWGRKTFGMAFGAEKLLVDGII